MDSFIGRQNESAMLTSLFRRHRLITLFGAAGVGKTRMAKEFAASGRVEFPDGIYFVEFAGVSSAELVGQAVALVLGAEEHPGSTIEDTVVAALGGQDVLLILDNCEHLVEACGALVATILHRCPHARVLVTSRETLRLSGEQVFPIGELAVADAVRLFADRALSVAAPFKLGPDNLEAVRSICQRLDNVPLAVELAARLVRLLPVDDILSRLEDRFDLLVTGTRSADAKHRSLYEAIDWSYGLLSTDEQTLLRRLSMLPGGFDVDLAAAVAADVGLPVIELISSLESKSLLAPVVGTASPVRFRQGESIRAYARERLVEGGEWKDATERLVAALTAVATAATEQFVMPDKTAGRLYAEQDNLLFAIECLRDRADIREPLLVAALARCRSQHGIVADTGELLAATVRIEDAPTAHRALALVELAWHDAWCGNNDVALAHAREAVKLAADGDWSLQSQCLSALGFAHQIRGEYEEAAENFATCLRHLRSASESPGIGVCLHNLAWATMLAGDLDHASSLLDEALPIYQKNGDQIRMAALLHTAGTLALHQGDLATAHERFTAGLSCLDAQRVRTTPDLLEGLAVVGIRNGRIEWGLRIVGAAAAQRHAMAHPGEPWWQAQVTAAVDDARVRRSGTDVDRALEHGRRMPEPAVFSYALQQEKTGSARSSASDLVSAREREVVALVARGSTDLQIAEHLRISERTVQSHLASVRTKLDLRSRAQVAAWAVQNLDLSQAG